MGKGTEIETYVPDHGRGRLRRGNPGNSGGGRPPDELRQQLRGSFGERVRVLEDFADAKVIMPIVERCPECGHEPEDQEERDPIEYVPKPEYILKAIDMMGKYGLGQAKDLSVEVIQGLLFEQIEAIHAEFEPDLANRILSVIEPIWRQR